MARAKRRISAAAKARLSQAAPAALPPDRRSSIISEAAKLFARKGFDATSMRDIARAAHITVGASYWYFASKEELFSAVHATGLKAIRKAVLKAIDGVADPWARLEIAAQAHCNALLHPRGAIAVLLPPSLGPIRRRLVAQRDQYDKLFRELIEPLDIPKGVDRKVFRMQLLVSLNGTFAWYRPGGKYSPGEIAQQVVRMLRPRAGKPGKKQQARRNSINAAP